VQCAHCVKPFTDTFSNQCVSAVLFALLSFSVQFHKLVLKLNCTL